MPCAIHGHTKDGLRTHYGLPTDGQRAIHGHTTDALLSSCFRGTPVERAGVCSSVVRSAFVRRSVASCVAFVLCWFVWRSCAAADRAAAHRGKPKTADCGSEAKGGGLSSGGSRACDGLLTGGHLSDADNLRHAEMGGGGAAAFVMRTHDGLADGLSDAQRSIQGRIADFPRTSRRFIPRKVQHPRHPRQAVIRLAHHRAASQPMP